MSEWAARIEEAAKRAARSPIMKGLRTYFDGLKAGAEIFRQLLPLGQDGWALSTYGVMMAPEAHAQAAAMATTDRRAAARELERGWSGLDAQRAACALVPYVYQASERALALRRQALLERAVARFQEGLYEEAVLLLYSQLDGVFRDFAQAHGERAFARLFSRAPVGKKHEDLKQFGDLVTGSDKMIGTEYEFFLQVRDGMTMAVDHTTVEDHPSRHGVLHGRVLGYGTRRRAAQAFAFLAACLDLLIASLGDELSITDEENDMPSDDMPEGLTFILSAMLFDPVRSFYLSDLGQGKDLLVTDVTDVAAPPHDASGRT